MTTYNQVRYVEQCLQSLVDQKTDFPFEVVVADDCSTDGTGEIIHRFATKYPDLVRVIAHRRNVGVSENYRAAHGAARGEYIAHVDGDDYALAGKLMALASALDAHPEANVVWHRMRIFNERTGTLMDDLIDVELQPRGGFSRADLLACGSVGSHSAKMYRAHRRAAVDPNITELMDFYLTVEHVGDGRALWIPGFHGVYRRGVGVLAHAHDKYLRLNHAHIRYLLQKYPEFRKEINALSWLKLAVDVRHLRRRSPAWETWLRSLHPLGPLVFVKYLHLYKILRLPSE